MNYLLENIRKSSGVLNETGLQDAEETVVEIGKQDYEALPVIKYFRKYTKTKDSASKRKALMIELTKLEKEGIELTHSSSLVDKKGEEFTSSKDGRRLQAIVNRHKKILSMIK